MIAQDADKPFPSALHCLECRGPVGLISPPGPEPTIGKVGVCLECGALSACADGQTLAPLDAATRAALDPAYETVIGATVAMLRARRADPSAPREPEISLTVLTEMHQGRTMFMPWVVLDQPSGAVLVPPDRAERMARALSRAAEGCRFLAAMISTLQGMEMEAGDIHAFIEEVLAGRTELGSSDPPEAVSATVSMPSGAERQGLSGDR